MMKSQSILALIFALSALAPVRESRASTWARTYGGSAEDWPMSSGASIQQTADGGYIAWAYTLSFGGSNYPNWALKLNSVGSIVWEKQYDSPQGGTRGSIQEVSGGGYIVTAQYGSSINQQAVWVMSLDPTGSILWQNSYGGPTGDSGISVKEVSGGYVVAGPTLSFAAAGVEDFYVLKLDSSGSVIWQRTYGGPGSDEAHSILETASGDYVVAGFSNSFGSGPHNYGWVLKLDATTGHILWQNAYGDGSNIDEFFSVAETSAGDLILCGATDLLPNFDAEAWVMKLDGAGNNILWQKSYGATGFEGAKQIQQTADSGYVFVGTTDSFGGGVDDVLVVKLDAAGNISWQKTYGGTDYDDGLSIQQTADGGYILSAGTYSYGAGAGDLWILKLDANGDIADSNCPVGTPSLAVTNTSATAIATTASALTPSASSAASTATPTTTNATTTTVCGPPTIIQGSSYCIEGVSTGADYSWFIDLDGDGIIDVGEPYESTVTGIASGQNAVALATAFVNSINNNSTSSTAGVSATLTSTPECFTIQAIPRCYGGPTPGAACVVHADCGPGGVCMTPVPVLYVGPPGNPTFCKVTASGCTYNPTIFQVTPTSGLTPDPTSEIRLGQNAPNPFVPRTRIPFSVAQASHVVVEVFDVSGRRLRVLADKTYAAGEWAVDWDGRDESGVRLSAGAYFYRLVVNGRAMARKMILLP